MELIKKYYKNGIGVRCENKDGEIKVICSKLHYERKFNSISERLLALREYQYIVDIIKSKDELTTTDKIKVQLRVFGQFTYLWCSNWQLCWCAIDGVRQPNYKFDDIELLATAQHWQREYTDLDIEKINNSLKTLFGKELKL